MHHALLLALAWTVRSESSFQRPAPVAEEGYHDDVADNTIYDLGQNLTVQWTTDLDAVDLYLVRFYPSSDWEWAFLENSTDTEYPWVIGTDVTTNSTSANMFYFDLRRPGNDTSDGQSHDFNVTITTTQPTQTATTRPTQTETKGSGLSTGGIAGVAVGAAVVAIALLGGLFFWRRRGEKGTPVEHMALAEPVSAKAAELGPGEAIELGVPVTAKPAELGMGEAIELGVPVEQAGHGPQGRYEVG